DAQQALVLTNEDLEYKVEEVERANKKISMANEQIKSFANILSHDLRTPITSVQALIDEVRYELEEIQTVIEASTNATPNTREAVNEFIPETLAMIDSAIGQMDLLTRQILTVAKDEARTYTPVEIHMQERMQAMVNAQAGVLHEKGVEVTIDPLPDVYADEVMVQQVFTNLISNAIKYLDPERPGQIVISGYDKPNETIFTVQDNGLGIPDSQAERVFQLFRRVGKHANIEGNGFGLFYIRNMVQRIDGDIWFESKEGIGTRFYVSLPKTSERVLSPM
ncbi:MAG: HAMP domain-containing sensor histidine kinase, partial [Chloroflexota bacterium]